MWVVGTLDDRRFVQPFVRILVAVCGATVLWATDLGWEVSGSAFGDLVLTLLWVVGLVASFNLLDNMDGATSAVAGASCAGLAVLALIAGEPALATLAVGLVGACLAFLRYNLARPARVFLGDGGSMPIGFIVAALAMAASHHVELDGWSALVIGAMLAGIPILDTTLVVISRRRNRVSLITGGRDHITHRLRRRLGSEHEVALTLSLAQLGLAALANVASELGNEFVLASAAVCALAGGAVVAILQRPGWAPPYPHSVG